MPSLSAGSQALIAKFGQQPGVSPDQVNNLQSIINASPALIDQINRSVAHGQLKHIVALTNPNAGGEYAPGSKEMRLPLAKLATPASIGEITFVLGHELQHGANAANVATASGHFAQDVAHVASSAGPVHDYTTALGKLLAANRRDEASAEIAGWNAVASAVKSGNPKPDVG